VALDAVSTQQALPLADILASNGITDQVIDAALLDRSDGLVYRLKLLSADGRLTIIFLQAKTGLPVGGY
jgi:hypothetical protein